MNYEKTSNIGEQGAKCIARNIDGFAKAPDKSEGNQAGQEPVEVVNGQRDD